MDKDGKWWRRVLQPDSLLLLVALIAGISGAAMSARYLGARAASMEASLRNRYDTRAIVVAAADLHADESLDSSHLAVRRVPKEFLPDDAVPVERVAELLGGRTAISIRRGTPVVTAALRETRDPPRLSSILAGERRALTIAVDQMNSQAGNLQPGDWVDLYYSHSVDGDSILVPLLQHVEILAAGASLLGSNQHPDIMQAERSFSTVTLGLSADDAARVVLAQQAGNVSLVLRAPADVSQISMEPRSSRDLLRRPAKTRSIPVESRIELLVGGSGNLTPERSWLPVGQGRTGDAS
jgi:pilus assembly protein CpaB